MTDNLKKLLSKENVSDSPEVLEKYRIVDKIPSFVLCPTTIDQVSEIMKLARREGKKILISGNSSQHYFGSGIESLDWCLSLNRMNKIIEHEAADLTVTVESGITLPQLQKSLIKHKQFLPLDPFGVENRTLGGIVATNSAGPLRLLYGTCRDLVLGMKVGLPDGTIIRVGGKTVKNVAGYDLSKLFIGSMGTLGIIVEITFKLSPLPAQSQTLWAGFDKFNGIPGLVKSVCSSNLVVNRCEYLNAVFAENNLSDDYVTNKPHNLLLNIQGHSEMVNTSIEKLQRLISEWHAKKIRLFSEIHDAELWNQIIQSKSDNEKFPFGIHYQISIPKSFFGQVVSALEKYSIENNLSPAIHAHAGNGIINVYFWGNLTEEQMGADLWRSQIESFRQLAQDYQGSMIVRQAPNDLREPELIWGKPGKDFALVKSIKSKYDAQRLLVTGRFIGGL